MGGSVDLRTVLFLLFVFALGAINDWVVRTLKNRHPELQQLLPKLFGHKIFVWAAGGVLVSYSLAKGIKSREKVCEQSTSKCEADDVVRQMLHVTKLGILYIVTHLEVILAAPFIWFGGPIRRVVWWSAIYIYLFLMFTREIMLLPVDNSYYIPLVCFVTVVYNLATQSIRGVLYSSELQQDDTSERSRGISNNHGGDENESNSDGEAEPEETTERRRKSGEVATDFVGKLFSSNANREAASDDQDRSKIGTPHDIDLHNYDKNSENDSLQRAKAEAAAEAIVSPGDEREALRQFYISTQGDMWTQSDKWCTDAPLGDWYGVTVDEEGHCTDLDLGENNLRGRIPVSLGTLVFLQGLYLDTNYLRGRIPDSLGNCSILRDVYLNNNQLTGWLPESVSNLSQLEVLNVESNHLDGELPKNIGALKHLVCLDLRWNHMSGCLPVDIGYCVCVEEIWLQGNNFEGQIPDSLTKLTRLEWLGLSNNNFENVGKARSLFRGRFGSRVGIFIDGNDSDGSPSARRKSSAPPSLMLRGQLTEKEMRHEERFRRMRRIYGRRGSVRRASTTQLSNGISVDVSSPTTILSAGMDSPAEASPRPSRFVRTPRRKGSAPASLRLSDDDFDASREHDGFGL